MPKETKHDKRPSSEASVNRSNRHKLLINEPPLQVLPTLAVSLGLTEALALQQLHYLFDALGGEEHDGMTWIHMTEAEWHERSFPFWSRNTIRGVFEKLQKRGIVKIGNYNKRPGDQTKWYAIDYEALDRLPDKKPRKKRDDYPNFGQWANARKAESKNWTGGVSKNWTMERPNIGQPLPEIPSEKPISEKPSAEPAIAVPPATNPLGEEIDETPIPPKQNDLIQQAKADKAMKRLNDETLNPLVNALEPEKEKSSARKEKRNVPPNPTCFMGDGRYVGPFPSMAAAQRYSSGHGTITDLSAVPAGKTVEAAPVQGKKAKADVPAPGVGVMDAIVGLCYPDVPTAWKMTGVASRARRCYNTLAACCAPITTEKIQTFRFKWALDDFRGKKGQRPTFEQIPDAWLKLMTGDPNGSSGTVLDGIDQERRSPDYPWGYK